MRATETFEFTRYPRKGFVLCSVRYHPDGRIGERLYRKASKPDEPAAPLDSPAKAVSRGFAGNQGQLL